VHHGFDGRLRTADHRRRAETGLGVRVVVALFKVDLVNMFVGVVLVAMDMLVSHMLVVVAGMRVVVDLPAMGVLMVVGLIMYMLSCQELTSFIGGVWGASPFRLRPRSSAATWSMWRSASSRSDATCESKSPYTTWRPLRVPTTSPRSRSTRS